MKLYLSIIVFITIMLSTHIYGAQQVNLRPSKCSRILLIKVIQAPHYGKTYNIESILPRVTRDTCREDWKIIGNNVMYKNILYSVHCFITADDSAYIYKEINSPNNIWIIYINESVRPQCHRYHKLHGKPT